MTWPDAQTLRQLFHRPDAQRRRFRWASGLEFDALLGSILLYSILAFAIAGVYVTVIFLTTLPYGAPREELSPLWWQNLLALILAILIVALLYRPLRRGVSQVIYGQHDDPYAIIAQLNQRLEASQPPQAILASAAETIAGSLKLAYVCIEARNGTQTLAAEYGTIPAGADAIPIPLAYQGAPVGELRVTPRGTGAAFHGVDLKLLNELARQVAIALYATQVTAELQASRESIVTARGGRASPYPPRSTRRAGSGALRAAVAAWRAARVGAPGSGPCGAAGRRAARRPADGHGRNPAPSL